MMPDTRSVRVVMEKDQVEPLAVEIIETSICKISDAMKNINNTRLTRKALVVLICANSGLGKGTVECVLNNLEALEEIYLKPKKEKK